MSHQARCTIERSGLDGSEFREGMGISNSMSRTRVFWICRLMLVSTWFNHTCDGTEGVRAYASEEMQAIWQVSLYRFRLEIED